MEQRRRVIALGFFDGVHLGHGAILKEAAALARETDAVSAALTFDMPPGKQMGDGQAVPLLTLVEDRRALMQELYGIRELIVLPFDEKLRHMQWDRFLEEVLLNRYRAAGVVAGSDYRFGYRGGGDAERLQSRCAQLGIACRIVEKVSVNGTQVSSTHIRALLMQGEMAQAVRFLGHPHRMSGTVEHGRGLGGRLGIPTTNLTPGPQVLVPAYGVYVSKAVTEDGQIYSAVTNIGVRPTVDHSGHVSVESWLLDFAGDLYGKPLCVQLYDYLRPEKRFSSVEELTQAIRENGEQVRRYFEQK